MTLNPRRLYNVDIVLALDNISAIGFGESLAVIKRLEIFSEACTPGTDLKRFRLKGVRRRYRV
jgi:hypothetical protein